VSFALAQGEILGIIGPNGAGKSTLFNAITGIYRASAGRMRFAGTDLNGRSAHRIVAMGIARTFQSSRLFTDMSVLDNVVIGLHTRTKTSVLDAILRYGRARQELSDAADRAAELLRTVSVELFEQRYRRAGELAQADRRRLEIARALATEPKLLLLDEPSSGMDDKETQALVRDIRTVCKQRPDLSIMIIEHDMSLVAELPVRVMVLDYGRKIAEGSFESIRSLEHVQQAYLGGTVSHA
jgi:branched-chain amino acid transport system ATP-binding protein